MIDLELARVLAEVRRRLDGLSVPFVVGGSIASSAYGEPRLTRDVDLVIELPVDRAAEFAAAFTPDFYVSLDAVLEAVRDRRSFNAVHVESGFKVDFFVRGDTAFDHEEFRRALPTPLGDAPALTMPVKAPEDSILRKLEWYRAGGGASEQQWRDVLALLALNAGLLDDAHLDRWALELGVGDLLRRAREQASA